MSIQEGFREVAQQGEAWERLRAVLPEGVKSIWYALIGYVREYYDMDELWNGETLTFVSHAELRARYDSIKARQAEIAAEKQSRFVRRENILCFIETLRAQEGLLDEFEERLFRATVERITVHAADNVRIKFRGNDREVKAGAK